MSRGFDIGVRIIDEFLSKSGTRRCRSWEETAETIALVYLGCSIYCQVGFKMYLGVTASTGSITEKKFSIILDENPLIEFVELPDEYRYNLIYSNVLCGVIRGALSMVSSYKKSHSLVAT